MCGVERAGPRCHASRHMGQGARFLRMRTKPHCELPVTLLSCLQAHSSCWSASIMPASVGDAPPPGMTYQQTKTGWSAKYWWIAAGVSIIVAIAIIVPVAVILSKGSASDDPAPYVSLGGGEENVEGTSTPQGETRGVCASACYHAGTCQLDGSCACSSALPLLNLTCSGCALSQQGSFQSGINDQAACDCDCTTQVSITSVKASRQTLTSGYNNIEFAMPFSQWPVTAADADKMKARQTFQLYVNGEATEWSTVAGSSLTAAAYLTDSANLIRLVPSETGFEWENPDGTEATEDPREKWELLADSVDASGESVLYAALASRTLAVTVSSTASNTTAVFNASVQIETIDHQLSFTGRTNAQGIVTFTGVPSTTFRIIAIAKTGEIGTGYVLSSYSTNYATIVVSSIAATPAGTTYSSLTSETTGWDVSTGTSSSTSNLLKVDTLSGSQAKAVNDGGDSVAHRSLRVVVDVDARRSMSPMLRRLLQSSASCPYSSTPSSSSTSDTDTDGTITTIALTTNPSEGPTTASHSLNPTGSTSIKMRYRFETTEFPVYFGTKYNDYFAVTVRADGAVYNRGDNMNNLGYSTFDASGHTPWYDLTVQLDPDRVAGTPIEITLEVANVGDGALQSTIRLKSVEAQNLDIETAEIVDKCEPMYHGKVYARCPSKGYTSTKFLSMSPITFNSGKIPVWGFVSMKGDKADPISKLQLVVTQGSNKFYVDVTSSTLSSLKSQWSSNGQAHKNDLEPLVQLDSSAFSCLSSTATEVTLSLYAESQNGATAQKDLGSFTLLHHYENSEATSYSTKAYETLDPNYGPSWIQRRIKPYMDQISAARVTGFQWGDCSNVHAGPKAPHATHSDGLNCDAISSGMVANSKGCSTSAEAIGRMVEVWNAAPYSIEVIFATFQPGSAAADAVAAQSTATIKHISGHCNHFHIRFK